MKISLPAVCSACLVAALVMPPAAGAQEPPPPERARDGVYEITLKSPERRRVIVDELVRDRDLNPRSLYRVKTGGYLAFEEAEWVDKIEFKIFDRPVTELPPYRRFGELLVDINERIFKINQMLASYDQLAFRLMNICDKSRFPSLESIDDNIAQQLTVYRKLVLLRDLVVNSLSQFVRDRSCIDKFVEYQKSLNIYSQQLMTLTQNYERLSKRVLTLAEEVQPVSRTQDKESPAAPPTTGARP
jgi:hypothetical protein